MYSLILIFKKGVCIKQFYLYNPINNFDVMDTSFLIALEAGKIEYWKDLTKICQSKIFSDSESVSNIKVIIKAFEVILGFLFKNFTQFKSFSTKMRRNFWL